MVEERSVRQAIGGGVENCHCQQKPDSATAALELAQTASANFDLLLTDIIMPHMSGVELYDQVRALRPGIKRLYMTGYAGDDLSRRGLLESDMVVLEKPFDSTQCSPAFEQCWIATIRERLRLQISG